MTVKTDLIDLLKAKLDSAALTKDDGAAKARWKVMEEYPPWILVRDFFVAQGYDLLFTVSRLREEAQRIIQDVPMQYEGRYPVKIWAIAKTGIDGVKLREKAFGEVKRVFKENPVGSRQSLNILEDDDRPLGGYMLYSSTLNVRKTVYE